MSSRDLQGGFGTGSAPSSVHPALSPGDKLGSYVIEERLGAGGMGVVYKARDEKLNRFVALKVLASACATDPGFRDRFQREARAIAALTHPNIVTVHSIEEHDGSPFLTMELVGGERSRK
jgi:serine/threonine protein kinase